MASVLHVNDLRISFRTSNGKVQAVRGINFDLEKGKTLSVSPALVNLLPLRQSWAFRQPTPSPNPVRSSMMVVIC